MKRWREDLLDHLAYFALLHSDHRVTLAEAVAQVKDEIPSLSAVAAPSEGSESDYSG